MVKNLLNEYADLSQEDKKTLLKLLKEDLVNIESNKMLKIYEEVTIGGNKYFVLNIDEENNEVTYCMKDVLSREEMLKYFPDDWYQDTNDYCVRYNSNIRNNKFQDSYIYKMLNSTFKEDKLKGLDIIGYVRLLTKEEIHMLPERYVDIERYYWTMTPYNYMYELTDGEHASVFYIGTDGCFRENYVSDSAGVRPVIKIKKERLAD